MAGNCLDFLDVSSSDLQSQERSSYKSVFRDDLKGDEWSQCAFRVGFGLDAHTNCVCAVKEVTGALGTG